MELYLLRHAIAVMRGINAFPNDDRPLTPEGILKMKKAATGIRTIIPSFDVILTSPLQRASKTATIVAESLRNKKAPSTCDLLLPGTPHESLFHLLASYKRASRVLLVGHEPDLSHLASVLLCDGAVNIEFKKGGICRIDIEKIPPTKPGTLIWHLSPKILRQLA